MSQLHAYVRLLQEHPRYVAFGFVHFFFSSLGQSFLIGTFKPYWLTDLELTDQQFGNLYAAANMASAVALTLVGGLADRFPLRYLSLVDGLLLVFFCWAAAQVSHGWMLMMVLFGLRFTGQGFMVLLGSTGIARYFLAARGKALGLATLGLPVGEALFPALLVLLFSLAPWTMGWQALGLSVVVVFLPLVFWLVPIADVFQRPLQPSSGPAAENHVAASRDYTRAEVLRDPVFYAVLPVALFTPFFFTGIVIHQNMLSAAKGWTPETFATAFAGYGVIRFVANLMAGPFIDRYRAQRVFMVSLAPMAVGMLLLALMDAPWVAWAFLMLAGVTASTSALATGALWAELYGGRHLGAIKSMAATVMVFSTAVAPVVFVPFLENSNTVRLTMLAAAGLAVLFSVAAALAVRRHRAKTNVAGM